MDFKILNLKENSPSVEEAMAILSINLEISKLEGVKVIKVIHGYGSHGMGGLICFEVRKYLRQLKKQKKIKDLLFGNDWSISNSKCIEILTNLKDCYKDEDLNNSNPGITIIIL